MVYVCNKSRLLTLWLSCTCLGKRLAMDSYSACIGSKFLPENYQRTVLFKRLAAFCVCNGTFLEAFLSHSPLPSHSYLLQNRNIANKPTPWILEVTSLLSKKNRLTRLSFEQKETCIGRSRGPVNMWYLPLAKKHNLTNQKIWISPL